MKLSLIKTNPRNPRRISKEQLAKLCDSIKRDPEFMRLRPIVVDDDGMILGGNQRYKACLELCMTQVPDEWVVTASGLTEEQRRRFILVDNAPSGMSGDWDDEILIADFEMPELAALGFELPDMPTIADDTIDAEPQVDKAEELRAKWDVESGQLWQLGDHRLLCGDSTNAEDVARCLGGVVPLLMVTDPPYGVEYDPSWRAEVNDDGPNSKRAVGKVANDDRADWSEAWRLFTGDVAYVWHADRYSPVVAGSLESVGLDVRYLIVWAKQRHTFGRGHYHHQHEPCWCVVRKGATAHWAGDRTQTTLWQIDNNRNNETGHSTQKPVECMARPMRNHDAPEVYDPFLGSGTTLIAAEQLGRKCYGIEISPGYVAVTLQRYADATGKTPKLVEE